MDRRIDCGMYWVFPTLLNGERVKMFCPEEKHPRDAFAKKALSGFWVGYGSHLRFVSVFIEIYLCIIVQFRPDNLNGWRPEKRCPKEKSRYFERN